MCAQCSKHAPSLTGSHAPRTACCLRCWLGAVVATNGPRCAPPPAGTGRGAAVDQPASWQYQPCGLPGSCCTPHAAACTGTQAARAAVCRGDRAAGRRPPAPRPASRPQVGCRPLLGPAGRCADQSRELTDAGASTQRTAGFNVAARSALLAPRSAEGGCGLPCARSGLAALVGKGGGTWPCRCLAAAAVAAAATGDGATRAFPRR